MLIKIKLYLNSKLNNLNIFINSFLLLIFILINFIYLIKINNNKLYYEEELSYYQYYILFIFKYFILFNLIIFINIDNDLDKINIILESRNKAFLIKFITNLLIFFNIFIIYYFILELFFNNLNIIYNGRNIFYNLLFYFLLIHLFNDLFKNNIAITIIILIILFELILYNKETIKYQIFKLIPLIYDNKYLLGTFNNFIIIYLLIILFNYLIFIKKRFK